MDSLIGPVIPGLPAAAFSSNFSKSRHSRCDTPQDPDAQSSKVLEVKTVDGYQGREKEVASQGYTTL